jgi:aryl-alcohol dehydrogenase-like predicted oxidoreductase
VFDVVQATFNCLEPSLAEPLAGAHAAGIGVIVKEAVANGRLTEANRRREDDRLVRELRAVAAARSCRMTQLALAFVLERPWVDAVLSGAATRAQLVSHVDAQGVVLDDAARAALAAVAETPARYWATRASLPWS